MSRDRPQIVAHRGASFDAPENTLASFKLAFKQNADAIEGDFHLTADGEIVCHHDPTTGRCGDRDLMIATSTLKELRRVDVGRWKSPKFTGQRIPKLSQVLALVPAGRSIFIELKTGPEIVPFLLPVLSAGPVPRSNIVLMSFNKLTLLACKLVLPEMTTNWLTDWKRDSSTGRFKPSPEEVIYQLKFSHADGLGARANPGALTPMLRKQMHKGGYELNVWTVDKIDLAEAMTERGVAAITSNRPALLLNHFKQSAASSSAR